MRAQVAQLARPTPSCAAGRVPPQADRPPSSGLASRLIPQRWLVTARSQSRRIVAFVDQPQADQSDHRLVVGDGAALVDDDGCQPPVAITAVTSPSSSIIRVDHAVDLAGEAVDDAGLQALHGVLADDPGAA